MSDPANTKQTVHWKLVFDKQAILLQDNFPSKVYQQILYKNTPIEPSKRNTNSVDQLDIYCVNFLKSWIAVV